jgi:SAM-dependent methyltransferase
MQPPDTTDTDGLLAYYGQRAPEYDRIYAKPERQPDLRAIEQWLPALFRGSDLLEVACGTGYWTRYLAPVARNIVALDASPRTLDIARARPGAGGVRFTAGDAYRLPFEAARFDGAFAGFWISHVPRERFAAFFGELHRVLRAGARVVLLDNRYVEGSSTPVSETDARGNTYQARRLDDGSAHRVLKNFPSQDEMRGVLDAAGTIDFRWHEWTHYWAVDYRLA